MKVNWFKATRILIGVMIFIYIELIAVLGVFIYNFKDQQISNDISDWASFGDFFGGVLSPLLGLYSLVLLGTITWIIAKRSEDKNIELNLRLKRIDAYRDITASVLSIEYFYNLLFGYGELMTMLGKHTSNVDLVLNKLSKKIEKMEILTSDMSNTRTLFESFPYMYGHLFNNISDGENFKSIILKVREVSVISESINVKAQCLGLGANSDNKLLLQFNQDAEIFTTLRMEFLDLYMVFTKDLSRQLT